MLTKKKLIFTRKVFFTWPTTMYNLRAKNQQTGTKTITFLHRGESRGKVQGVRKPPEMTLSFFHQLSNTTLWFIGVEVKYETRLKNFC